MIFDMDGVLVDSHPAHKNAWRNLLLEMNQTFQESDLDYVLDGHKKTEILQHFFGDVDPATLAEYGRRKDEFFQAEIGLVTRVEGVLAFLGELQNAQVPMAVATSASSDRAHYLLEKLDLKPFFNAIVTGTEVRNGKPDPALFLQAAEKLRIDPRHALVVEDAASGVIGAKRAGMKCLAIASYGRQEPLKMAGADLVVESFTEVSLASVQHLVAGN